jgi:hypothetical protein
VICHQPHKPDLRLQDVPPMMTGKLAPVRFVLRFDWHAHAAQQMNVSG